MDYLRLLIALSLPWLGGYFWLAAIESRLGSSRPHRARQAGYGLFIGYAGLQGIILAANALTGSVQFWPLQAAVAAVCVAGALLAAKRPGVREPRDTPVQSSARASTLSRVLLATVLLWTTLHLLFVAIEILHRPVFPWDAWLNWIYRAKAWYYQGQIATMDNPEQWLQGAASSLYNVAGDQYPTFSPVLALWSALALGSWSETLVNVPVLFCGVAICLGIYGQCREFGMDRWLSALTAYLLLSIPLLGTHLALAGNADIWMAGFTGLGFIALFGGIIRDDGFQLALGLGMVALGIATKLEGAVWLLAALLMLALALRARITLTAMAITVAIAAIGWWVNISYVNIPLLGGLGIAEGRVHIPLLGSYALQTFELWDDYWANFFASGTWHLLWTLVLLTAIGLCLLPAGALRRTISVFYAVLLASQLFIFEGTESGQWAADWTAINRLPLHFAPPLVFSVVLVWHALLVRGKTLPTARVLTLLPAASLATVVAGVVVYLFVTQGGTASETRTFSPAQMPIVVGSGHLAGDTGVIEQYQNGVAILSSGPVQLDPEQLKLLSVTSDGPNQSTFKFFWRNGTAPDNLHAIEIGSNGGTHLVNLAELSQWHGEINELGLIFYADGDKPARFHQLALGPQSLQGSLRQLAYAWTQTVPWSQRSVNWWSAGSTTGLLTLPALAAAWVLLTLLAGVCTGRLGSAGAATAVCALLAWAMLDLRWTGNSVYQAARTMHTYPLVSASALDFGDDRLSLELVDAARASINQPGRRTVITGEDPSMQFQVLRAKYHALPAAAYAYEGPLKRLSKLPVDYLLVLRKHYTDPAHKPIVATEYAARLSRPRGRTASVVWDRPAGFLLNIRRAARPHLQSDK